MTRRTFLAATSAVTLSDCLSADVHKQQQEFNKVFEKLKPTLQAVQMHLFPEGSQLPSAEHMKATLFLQRTIIHPTYDKDIRNFIMEGASELFNRTHGTFVTMHEKEKEKALRAYETTHYGSNWLSRIMTLTMEAIFSDPIYGSNIAQAGWNSVNSYGGSPRPKERYIEL